MNPRVLAVVASPSAVQRLPGVSWSPKCGVRGTCSDSQALSGQLLGVVSVLIDLCQRANKAGPLVVSRYGRLLRADGERAVKRKERITERQFLRDY